MCLYNVNYFLDKYFTFQSYSLANFASDNKKRTQTRTSGISLNYSWFEEKKNRSNDNFHLIPLNVELWALFSIRKIYNIFLTSLNMQRIYFLLLSAILSIVCTPHLGFGDCNCG